MRKIVVVLAVAAAALVSVAPQAHAAMRAFGIEISC